MEKKESILKASGIFKSFGATKALRGVELTLIRGNVHGLIGENGSGKSTLSSIIAGLLPADSGQMEYMGEKYMPECIFDAQKHGIAMIGQEQNTFEDLSVSQNIFIGKEEQFLKGFIVDEKKMDNEARKILDVLGLDKIDEKSKAKYLDFEQRKLVEIARALYYNPQLLIIDETSTALGKYGREILYSIIEQQCAKDRSTLFISHDIDEIMSICDRVTILRDGNMIKELKKEEFDTKKIKQFMVGREIKDNYYRADYENRLTDEIALEVKNIYTENLKDVSLKLHFGEILGIGGLADCGMHELGMVLFGLNKAIYGNVTLKEKIKIVKPTTALKNKMAYISKNRDKESLMLASTIKENICLPSYDKLKKGSLITKKSENEFANKSCELLKIKMDNINQNVMYLSGGNKQKVAVSKWLGTNADIYIFDCPTRGIDVGVQSDIYDLLQNLKMQKKAIIMITEELPELIGMSDRILILKNGKISAEVNRNKSVSESTLIDYII